jgi:hypothetical protein
VQPNATVSVVWLLDRLLGWRLMSRFSTWFETPM